MCSSRGEVWSAQNERCALGMGIAMWFWLLSALSGLPEPFCSLSGTLWRERWDLLPPQAPGLGFLFLRSPSLCLLSHPLASLVGAF